VDIFEASITPPKTAKELLDHLRNWATVDMAVELDCVEAGKLFMILLIPRYKLGIQIFLEFNSHLYD
jgi:hypothetical protein